MLHTRDLFDPYSPDYRSEYAAKHGIGVFDVPGVVHGDIIAPYILFGP